MPVAMTKGGQRYYLAYDQVGTLRAVTDASGNAVKRIGYDTFGNVISDSNTAFAVPFGFAGGLYDADTGLIRFGYRDYDPDTGRWTAKDPIRFAGGDTDLYGYCLGDPVNGIDPKGLYGGKIIKLSKKLWGKVMPGRGRLKTGDLYKDPRVKVYGDSKAKSYLRTKIFEDGTVESKIGLKIPKKAIDIAVDALKNAPKSIIPFVGELIDPFDAEALGNGDLPDYLLYPDIEPTDNNSPCH